MVALVDPRSLFRLLSAPDMHVIATAGHAGHGKSALVHALTGMDPRPAEPGLGFAWMALPSGERLAFVDVPGHQSLVPTMLAGVGPVPAVLFVVAADHGWKPQSAEHLAVLDALGIRHGLLVVTRADLADPGPVLAQASERMASWSLGQAEPVAVSTVTGTGLPDLAAALGRLADSLPVPDASAPVRIWVDGAFTAGEDVVVTGTLPAGTVRRGDVLVVTPSGRPVRILGIQSLGEAAAELTGPARAALRLGGAGGDHLGQVTALVQPGRWTLTDVVDVRLSVPGAPVAGPFAPHLPRTLTLHAGAALSAARVRLLGGTMARLTLRQPIPLHAGDRVLLRDPGPGAGQPGWPTVLGAAVLDVAPPPLARRGAGATALRELAAWPDRPSAADLLRRHGVLRASALLAMGVSKHPEPVWGEWLADPEHWEDLARRLGETVTAHAARELPADGSDPGGAGPAAAPRTGVISAGLTLDAARAALGLPDRRLVEALVRPPLRMRDGSVQLAVPSGATAPALPAAVTAAVQVLLADLAAAPFAAPEAGRLRQLGLDARAIAAAERAGLLLRVSDLIVLAPGADAEAGRVLAGLPQPFTAAEARQALRTTRRVAIPLLEFLDRAGITERLPDDRRKLRSG
jgi:selenocysteine-specific elongation factor